MDILGYKAGAGGIALPAPATEPDTEQTIRVWDPVVRLFHWSLVVSFAIAWATGDEMRTLHETAGYAIVGLLGVRVLWGFLGTAYARFSDFVYRPSVVAGYLIDAVRVRAKRYVGHNPAGGAMILALMATLATACGTGIMMTADAYWGVKWVQDLHEFTANTAVLLIGLHLVGVFVASVEHRENLVRAMITGRKHRG